MRPLITCSLLIVAVAATDFCALAQQQNHSTAILQRIHVAGNKFMRGDQPMTFKGLNTSDPDKLEREGHWNEEYFAEIKSWGANVVRFPVHPLAWRRRGEAAYLKLLDDGIRLAAQHELYVIVDWHSIGNLCEERFTATMYHTTKDETLHFWKTIATHYRNEPTVAFLELFNEPTIAGGTLGTCSWNDWKSLMEDVIAAIRSTGNEAIPLVAGFNWGYLLTDVVSSPVNAEGVAYVSHPYPQKRKKPWEAQWTADWGHVAEKYPLFLTEIGFCGEDDKGAHIPVISDESYGDAITAYAGARGLSYVVWVFDPQWSPMLITDWSFTPTRQGRYFKEALKKNGNNKP